ncbi:LysR family transcriptional regulator [Thiothrix fructosivorans]|uniref:LysR family transcriptional regulator n=1 Tax=Thiothrix fructosivorans TaxID=111770 RepID=A0A8B0SH14_9GAMM|nr:LysR family transcriptional regulator [Thiothrix fructosivorans]MBO0614933.1 LysR family transcriptional regulator [Thiothrix fructosivorans]QTX09740.1 LysR family transcriptional regulator [Thiothrix fructosivorans]
MNFQVLRYVVAATQVRHFGQAAEVCHVTQPSLSEQIIKFEEYLGVALFIRARNGVIPTQAGLKISALAQDALEIERKIKALSPRLGVGGA